jgi:hypothetical protein
MVWEIINLAKKMRIYLLILVFSLWGCNIKNDSVEINDDFDIGDEIEFHDDKKIKEIHNYTYYYTNQDGKKPYHKTISEFNLNGDLVKSITYNFEDIRSKTSSISAKPKIIIEKKKDFKKETWLDVKGKIIQEIETKRLDNNTIQETFTDYNNLEFGGTVTRYTVDKNNNVLSSVVFGKDSTLQHRDIVTYPNNNTKYITSNMWDKSKVIIEVKYLKFDKLGNWTEKENHLKQIDISGKVIYDNLDKQKRVFYYYNK